MPYDKDGKYYRKPVYRVQKTKKDFSLKKSNFISNIIFYLFGIISPWIFLALHILAIELAFNTNNFIWYVFPTSLGILISIVGEIQINKYINRGGKLSKIEIYILAILWWVINIPIGYFFYFIFIWARVVQVLVPSNNFSP